ncbi:alpha/beta hydrolase [Pseudarthrobacter raffinosi]|uniref:alpha/beta hydrolase n=1 Tax=Pseudarthrobacter raffinosi TaxID=2953651 RepID=UPI00208FCD8A|nr:alpha/beta hydrolase [Pseudarthrobacter sp. MDT3-9]MCO4250624.1 alpha/beta hydrolase [Pseudarthrobacter sp. MDT3-9]
MHRQTLPAKYEETPVLTNLTILRRNIESTYFAADTPQQRTNTADLYIQNLLRTAVAVAMYAITASHRPNASLPTQAFGFLMTSLWEQEPMMGSMNISRPTDWIEHSIVTVGAFSESANRASTAARERQLFQVQSFLNLVEKSGGIRGQALEQVAADISTTTGYVASTEASRARLPWEALEFLANFDVPNLAPREERNQNRRFDFLAYLEADQQSSLGAPLRFNIGDITVTAPKTLQVFQLSQALETAGTIALQGWLYRKTPPAEERPMRPGTAQDNSDGPANRRDTRKWKTGPKPPTVHKPIPISPPTVPTTNVDEFRPKLGEDGVVHRIWYGTNRRAQDPGNHRLGFLNGNDSSDKLNYGECLVNIPKSHKIGTVGPSLIRRILKPSTKRERLTLEEIIPHTKRELFQSSVRLQFAENEPGSRSALVYIHGFNNSFASAAVRAAQLGYDLNFEGLTAFFSWPSRAKVSLRSYLADRNAAESAAQHLAVFIETLFEDTDLDKVNFVVHSMGNLVVARAIQILSTRSSPHNIEFDVLILAAPDLEPNLFTQLAVSYPTISSHSVMYVSDADRALQASAFLQKGVRVGYAPPITVLPGIDTIEVSGLDQSFIGHDYYAESRPLLQDIKSLLDGNRDPKTREGLRQRCLDGQSEIYWTFAP